MAEQDKQRVLPIAKNITIYVADLVTNKMHCLLDETKGVGSVNSLNVQWYRKGQAGKATITFYNTLNITFPLGSPIAISINGKPFFHGNVFTYKIDRFKKVTVEAYDFIRYLKNKDSKWYVNQTASSIIKDILTTCNIPIGDIQETGYVLSTLDNFSNMTYLDMITKVLAITTMNTGKVYTLYHNPGTGKMDLTEAWNIKTNKVLTYGTSIINYTYDETIDREVYNYIQYAYDFQPTNKGIVNTVVEKDPITMQRWGLLKLMIQTDENVNPSKVQSMAKMNLRHYDRTYKILHLECIGDIDFRGGTFFRCELGNINGVNVTNFQIVETITHNITNGVHTMTLDTRQLDDDIYNN